MPKNVFDSVEERQIQLLFEAGWTDAQVAKFYGIDRRTITKWKKKNPEFKKKVKGWKEKADDPVERTLYQKAIGGLKIKETKRVWKPGGPVQEVIETVKELPPCTTSIIFWLKNRKREEWRDKVDLGGEDFNVTVTRKEYNKKSTI